MKRTIWISTVTVALLCLTCMAYALQTDPATKWTTDMPVSIGVTAYAGVWGSSPGPLIMSQGGLWFNVYADLVANGTVPCTISGALTTNNIPAGVTLYVRFADPDIINGVPASSGSAGLNAMKAGSTLNSDNNWVQNPGASSPSDITWDWKLSTSTVLSWTSTSDATVQSFNVTTPTSTNGTSWPVIYSVYPTFGGPTTNSMPPKTSVLTYTLTPNS